MSTIAKPVFVPVWAASGAITVPTSGKIAVGFIPSERGAAQYFNYLQNANGTWLTFVDALFTDGGNASGFAIGNMDLSVTAEANVAPLAKFRDYGNNIRTLTDHNGYRMGQVTEIEERWDVAPVTINVPLSAGVAQANNASFSFNGVWSSSGSGTLQLPLSTLVPPGAIVTSIVFAFTKSVAGDSVTFGLTPFLNGATPTGAVGVTKTIATGTGNASTDLFVSPTSGHGPKQIGFDGNPMVATDDTALFVQLTLTGTFSLYGVKVTYTAPPVGWTYTGVTLPFSGDLLTILDPQTGLNQRAMKIAGGSTGFIQGLSELVPNWEGFQDTSTAYAIEFMAKTGTISDANNKRQFILGVENINDGINLRYAGFHNEGSTPNWQFTNYDGSFHDTDTGVAIAANTVYRFRVEIYGTAVNSGGTTVKMRGYINGVKVVDVAVTTVAWPAQKIRPYFRAATTATIISGPYDFSIGRLRRVWNHQLAGDNL